MAISDTDSALEGIPRSAWERLAELANNYRQPNQPPVTPAEIKEDYVRAVQEHHRDPAEHVFLAAPPPKTATAEGCDKWGPYEIKFRKVFAIGVEAEVCHGPSWSSWTADTTVFLKLAGRTVFKTTYRLSPENDSITFKPDLYFVSARLTIGIAGTAQHCLRVSGDACYRWFGRHCVEFDETLFCFGSRRPERATA